MGGDAPELVDDRAPALYLLQSEDGRLITNDWATGPCLTHSLALAYVWSSKTDADGQRLAYEQVLGVALRIVEMIR